MTKEALAKLSNEELLKKHTAAKTMVWLLAIVLSGILLFFIYVSIQDGLTPLLAVPFALSAIIPLNVKNMNTFKKELDSRL
ncbi:MAG TPA: hypothetical protein DCG42_16165 [Maribacter sp.]|uniref:hypothetical protein n=1 Tax=unclassified Maribacter TaxID=2615042 RepID=UPI000EBFAC21|nr:MULTISPECIES: hypothetical protein [unclassified Maribacter]HAF78845.1 hypothetical protein [Maribacter sp.]HAI38625.1 hypothetical protein [Maribacter sp.]|tara:strand:+ start:105122 stop:105364 length:243 start_codon:yes stop_codon:yes gene_type:complete